MDLSAIKPPVRPDFYVVARFLDRLAATPDAFTHARLQNAVRLNYDLYRSYLALLTARGLARIEVDKEGVERVGATVEGRAAHARLVAWIRDAFGEVRF